MIRCIDIRPYSDKFYALATLPMNSVDEACRELERTMRVQLPGAEIPISMA